MKTVVAAVFISLVGLAIYLYVYLGISKPVQIAIEERGPLILVYQDHIGAYHQIGSKIDAVEKWARENNLPCSPTFGEFLDNPEAVDQDRLRSRGGCVMPQKPPLALPEEFQLEEKTKARYAVARFEGAPSVGPFTVYPKVREFLDQQRLKSTRPVVELYTVQGANVLTEFLFPLD